MSTLRNWVLLTAISLSAVSFAQQSVTLIHFGDDPDRAYVPVRAVARELGMSCDTKGEDVYLDGRMIQRTRALLDGTTLMPVRDLSAWNAQIGWDPVLESVTIDRNGAHVLAKKGVKRVVISKKAQELRAYEGDLLVFKTHVSTGRKGHGTPSGHFAAGRKERIHYSSLYDDSPMPWAVQVDGNVFIHGFTSVPRYPASHGCIRMPLVGGNPAKWFWHWIDYGTPVTIANDWSDAAQ